jgi:hypothetical protein
MTSYFTPEELVQYIYNEATPEKSAQIEVALQRDWSLREKLEVLKCSTDALDKQLVSPRTESVLKVLNYARETMAETVQHP